MQFTKRLCLFHLVFSLCCVVIVVPKRHEVVGTIALGIDALTRVNDIHYYRTCKQYEKRIIHLHSERKKQTSKKKVGVSQLKVKLVIHHERIKHSYIYMSTVS